MKKVDFGDRHVGRNILSSVIPLMVAQLLIILYNIVDRFYIGRIPQTGTLALGAVGLCFPIIVMITGVTNLFGIGGSPLFSMALGRRDEEEAREIITTAFRLECLSAFLIMVFGEIALVPLLHLFGASGEAMQYAIPYLRIYLLGTLCVMVSGGLNPYMTAMGYPQAGMMAILIGAVVNLILDPLFIFTFGLGVSGAAWATVIAQTLSLLYVLRFFASPLSSFRQKLRGEPGKPLFPHAFDIMALGVVPFIMKFTNGLVNLTANQTLLQWGSPIYISAMTIIASLQQLLETPVQSIAQGSVALVSFNYGARDAKKVWGGIKIMTFSAMTVALVDWLLLTHFPYFFVGFFTEDPALSEVGARAIRLYFFAFVFQAFQSCGQNVFRALNKRRQAIFFSLFRKVVIVIPLTLLLPAFHGLGTDGVFMAEPVSNVIGGLFCYSTMFWTIRRELAGWKTKDPEPVR